MFLCVCHPFLLKRCFCYSIHSNCTQTVFCYSIRSKLLRIDSLTSNLIVNEEFNRIWVTLIWLCNRWYFLKHEIKILLYFLEIYMFSWANIHIVWELLLEFMVEVEYSYKTCHIVIVFINFSCFVWIGLMCFVRYYVCELDCMKWFVWNIAFKFERKNNIDNLYEVLHDLCRFDYLIEFCLISCMRIRF